MTGGERAGEDMEGERAAVTGFYVDEDAHREKRPAEEAGHRKPAGPAEKKVGIGRKVEKRHGSQSKKARRIQGTIDRDAT